MTTVIVPEAIEIAPAGPAALEEVEAMVARCSAEALFHRFHGVVGPAARAAALLAGGAQEVFLARRAGRCVGVASLAGDGGRCPHIGVLVEDAWQRRGIGSALIATVAAAARRRGADAIAAEILSEDRFILGILARIGPVTTGAANPGYTARAGLWPMEEAGSAA